MLTSKLWVMDQYAQVNVCTNCLTSKTGSSIVSAPLHRTAETPTNDILIEESLVEDMGTRRDEEEESEGLFSGPKEMLEQSQAIKKTIQYNLGRRSGPRWSLPHQYIGQRSKVHVQGGREWSLLESPSPGHRSMVGREGVIPAGVRGAGREGVVPAGVPSPIGQRWAGGSGPC